MNFTLLTEFRTEVLLCEGSMCWPRAIFVGCDCDVEQLRMAKANVSQRPVRLLRADAARLPLAMASVDKAMTDLPFGKQRLRADFINDFIILHRFYMFLQQVCKLFDYEYA